MEFTVAARRLRAYAYPLARSHRRVKNPKIGGIANVMPRNTSTVASAGAAGIPNAVRPPVSAASWHADPTGDRCDVADHARADLHHDQLREVEALVEREQAQAEQQRGR